MRIAFYAPLKPPTHPIPSGDREVARLKLAALGIVLDAMTPEQVAYVSSWQHGT